MAINESTLADEDGDFSDWIEIQNVGDATLDLTGWRLTDEPTNPGKWTFPTRAIDVGQRIVVFASGKDRVGAGQLHTNFGLDGTGEYLAMISPAGDWIASEFDPYPQQYPDVSYGSGSEVVGDPLFQAGDPLRAFVPADDHLANTWTGLPANEPFDDSTAAGWLHGPSGAGFDGGGASAPEQVVGHALENRSNRDGAIGSIFVMESQRFGGPGELTTWSLYSDTGGLVTPLLLRANEFGEYEITGVGTTRSVGTSGIQEFAFELQTGSNSVDTDIVFGWKDGSNGTNNVGVADFDDGSANSVRYFGQQTNFTVGSNLGNGQAFNRTYSMAATATADFALEPLAYWSFDGNASDQASANADGEIRGATFSSETPSVIGSGESLHFDGGNDYVSVPLDVPETGYSSSLWFRTSTASRGLFAVVDNDLGNGGHDRHLFLSGGNIAARTWSNETIVSSGKNYADGQWHLVVHVVGAAAGGQRIYVDGELVASGSKAGSDFDWQQRVNIGFSNDAINDFFQGDIDDVAIWPAVLNSQQIDALYQGASPVALAGFGPWIGLDLEAEMAGRTSAYLRSTLSVTDPSEYDALEISLRYDDAVAVYLNGIEIVRRNVTGPLSHDSTADSNRPSAGAIRAEIIDVPLSAEMLQTGANILAYQLLADSSTDVDLLLAPEVFGLRALGDRFLDPTPGEGNGHGVLGFVIEPVISVPHGFYDQPFTTSITTPTANAQIYYTLDGSTPDPANPSAFLYNAPVSVSETTTLRAAAFLSGYESSPVSTASYLYLSDIAQQPVLPPGYPSTWQNVAADYEVDPAVLNNTLPGYGFDEAMLSLPTVSIVTDHEALWDASTGIYFNSNQRWERPASIELIYPDGSQSLQVDAGIRMHGNSSRNHGFTPKHSIRLHFRGEYGEKKLDFPVFNDADYISFDQLLLRASSTDSWPVRAGNFVQGVQRWHPDHGTYIRDQFMRDSQIALGWRSPHGTYVHLFLNGLYWGQYNLAERPTDDFQSSNFGGDPEEYDIIKDFAELQSGTKDAWNELFSLAGAGLATESAYQRIQGNHPDGTRNEDYPVLLDVDALIDYMILHIYSGAEDWPDHNYWAARRRGVDSEGFRFFVWDQEISNDSLVREYTRINTRFEQPIGGQNPSFLYGQLMQNETWRWKFIDRVHELLFNGGLLTPEQNHSRWLARQLEIDQSIVAESARWGDYRSATPYTREADWIGEMNWMQDRYWPEIHPIALQRFQSVGLYPDVDAPMFSQHGGQLSLGMPLEMSSAEGQIYYTVDGSDPRDTGAVLYTGAVTINDSIRVSARTLSGGEWSALTSADFQVFTPASALNLTVSEINYHPHGPTASELSIDSTLEADDFDYIELRNIGNETIDLHDVEFTDGIEFNFSAGRVATIQPGDFVLIVENEAAFQVRYGSGLPVAGQYVGGLNNSGEQIRIVDRFDRVIRSFIFSDNGDWPTRSDGAGSTLEAVLPSGDFGDSNAWRASSEFGGTPGAEGSGLEGEIVINEVLSHTDPPLVDSIEIYNTTDQPIEIGHWVISDSTANYDKFRIPAGVVLAGHAYLVFDEDDFNPGLGSNPGDFALNAAHGETVTLLEADAAGRLARFVDSVSFGAQANGESWGRWPNAAGELYPQTIRTLGGENHGPRVGPVVISEIMYAPPGGEHLEYIELFNTSQATVDLTHWGIGGIGQFSFSAGRTLAPGEAVLVVSFDPDDAASAIELSDFQAFYNLGPGTSLIGGYSGRLDNSGERVQLFRADEPPLEEPQFYPQLLEDRVTFDDSAPWPVTPAGSGHSLTRNGCQTWGDDSNSWLGTAPTPGVAACSSVVSRFLFYNGSKFDTGGVSGDNSAIATDKIALRPRETATPDHVSSYVHGLNGIMFDLAFRPSALPLTTADISVRIGNDDQPSDWPAAPFPQIATRVGEGVGESDRIVLTWPDQMIANTWLEVRVLANTRNGLAQDDIFYFGNLIGDVNGDGMVNGTDFTTVRANPSTFLSPANIDNRYDLNRDGRVNAVDLAIVRDHATTIGEGLARITPASASGKYVLPSEQKKWAASAVEGTTIVGQAPPVQSDEDAIQVAALLSVVSEHTEMDANHQLISDVKRFQRKVLGGELDDGVLADPIEPGLADLAPDIKVRHQIAADQE